MLKVNWCDLRLSARMKQKVLKIEVKPAMENDPETGTPGSADTKTLRFSLGVMKIARIRKG